MSHRSLPPVLSSFSHAAPVIAAVAAAAALTLAPAVSFAQEAPAPPPGAAPAPPPGGYYAPPPAGYAPPPGGYTTPPPGYGAPPPGYGAPPPGYGAPPPGYGAPPGGGYYAPGAAGPRVIEDWDDSTPVPAGYRVSTKIRTGLVVGGAVTLGALWILTAIPSVAIADASGNGATALGAIPVIGPFCLIPQISGNVGQITGDFFFVLDGLGQIAGAAMLIAGIAAPKKVLLRADAAGVTFVPKPMTFGKNGGGFGMAGTF